jgi:hypothetical protein
MVERHVRGLILLILLSFLTASISASADELGIEKLQGWKKHRSTGENYVSAPISIFVVLRLIGDCRWWTWSPMNKYALAGFVW